MPKIKDLFKLGESYSIQDIRERLGQLDTNVLVGDIDILAVRDSDFKRTKQVDLERLLPDDFEGKIAIGYKTPSFAEGTEIRSFNAFLHTEGKHTYLGIAIVGNPSPSFEELLTAFGFPIIHTDGQQYEDPRDPFTQMAEAALY